MTVLDLKDIKKEYRPGKVPVNALNGISLRITQGEFLVVSGASGSGKSTLLNLIGLIDQPTSGEINLNNTPVAYSNESHLTGLRRNFYGFIFQSFHLIPTMTVFENVEYPLQHQKITMGERRKKVMETLDSVGIADLAQRLPGEISGGQQQRVSIARAFVKSPAIILADEPTANLDSGNGRVIVQMMEQWNKERGITFILSTHDPEILSLSHRQIVMVDGKIGKELNPSGAKLSDTINLGAD